MNRSTRQLAPPLWLLYLVAGACATVGYTFLSSSTAKAGFSAAVAAIGAATVVGAVRRLRPCRAAPWLLLAAAQAVWAIGWTAWAVYFVVVGPFGVASPIYSVFLPAYPLLVAVLVLLLQAREDGPSALVETVVAALALFDIAWIALIHRYVEDGASLGLGAVNPIAYAALDVLVAAAALRALAARGRRTPAYLLVLAAAAAPLVSDALWNWATQVGSYSLGSWADSGWLLFSAFAGAAALHPSMRTEPEPRPAATRARTGQQFVLFASATVVGPILLAFDEGSAAEQLPVAAAAAITTLIVLGRLYRVMGESSKLAARLRIQNERLRDLDRLKDDFVASVSHELRTPLTSIQGYLELALDGDAGSLTDDQHHFLGVVRRNSDRLLRLVGDLLFVGQVDAGKLELNLEEVDLRTLVEESVQSARPGAEELGVALEIAVDAVLPLDADRVRLAQLLDNLVSNALKFTPRDGRVSVRVGELRDRAVIEVADTGIGISHEDQERLFERFFRASQATDGAIPGTGLGLAIVKAIVDAHGGSITVASTEGEGTTFCVELPLRATTSARTREQAEATV